jgi:putative drug exporter of the RND superfamily
MRTSALHRVAQAGVNLPSEDALDPVRAVDGLRGVLLSRMREEWRLTHDNASAVADGLAKTARVITAAAAIMICVFGSFVIGDPLHVLKVFGLGLAAAILIDATLVRMVLVPSVMELLGNANWWMPSWLARVVPTLGIEVDVAGPDRAEEAGR